MMIMILTVFIASACSSNTKDEAKESDKTSDTLSAITTEDLKKI